MHALHSPTIKCMPCTAPQSNTYLAQPRNQMHALHRPAIKCMPCIAPQSNACLAQTCNQMHALHSPTIKCMPCTAPQSNDCLAQPCNQMHALHCLQIGACLAQPCKQKRGVSGLMCFSLQQLQDLSALGLVCTQFCPAADCVLSSALKHSLAYYWFRAAVKLHCSMLGTNSSALCHVVQADLKFQSKDDKCWTAQLIQAFQDLRYRLQGIWRGDNNQLATYRAWFATHFACNAHQIYVTLPWYLFLDLPKQVMCKVSLQSSSR
eukprot:1157302-Pelagomonas_calceolata.AAC.12